MTLGENLEVINLRAIAGEYDSQARHIDIGKLPVLLENQQKGNYTVHLDPSRPGRRRRRCSATRASRRTPRSRKWLTNARVPDRALARHRPRSRSTRRSCSASARPARRRRASGRSTSPGPSSRRCTRTYDVEEGQRDARQARARQEGRRGLPAAHRRRRPAAARAHDLRRLPAVHPDRRDDRRAVEEDRHPRRGPGDGARARHRRACAPTSTRSTSRPSGAPTTCSATSRSFFPTEAAVPARPALRHLVLQRGRPGQEAAAAHARADGQVPQGVRRAGRRSGRSSPRTCGRSRSTSCGSSPWSSNSPASQGVRVIKNNMGNVPERLWNSAVSDNPHIAHTETWYFKIAESVTSTVGGGLGGETDAGERRRRRPTSRRRCASGPVSAAAARRAPRRVTARGRSMRDAEHVAPAGRDDGRVAGRRARSAPSRSPGAAAHSKAVSAWRPSPVGVRAAVVLVHLEA